MYTFIILLVCSLANSVYLWIKCKENIYICVLNFVVFSILSLLISFIISLIAVDTCMTYELPIKEVKHDLKSIEDIHTYKGSFVLGCGGFESAPSYYFYYQLPSGGYKMKSMPVNDVILFEGFEPKFIRRFKRSGTDKSNWFWGSGKIYEHEIESHLYVPTNTIKVDYNLDTK